MSNLESLHREAEAAQNRLAALAHASAPLRALDNRVRESLKSAISTTALLSGFLVDTHRRGPFIRLVPNARG